MALLINAADELFGFLPWPRVDMAQQPIQREGATPDQVRWILYGLCRHIVHLDHYSTEPSPAEIPKMNCLRAGA
jgi:hypothetical protein